MNTGNRKNVWIVYADKRKDFSKAEQFGELRDVFSSVGKHYNSDALIEHARHVLGQFQDGDYLLIVGDPTLVGICMVAISEQYEQINCLRWNREEFKYEPLNLNFSWQDE